MQDVKMMDAIARRAFSRPAFYMHALTQCTANVVKLNFIRQVAPHAVRTGLDYCCDEDLSVRFWHTGALPSAAAWPSVFVTVMDTTVPIFKRQKGQLSLASPWGC